MQETDSGAPGRVEVVVVVDDSHLSEIKRLADVLAEMGMVVEHRLDAVGVISGLIEKEKVGNLEEVEGVSGVEVAKQFQLPSPDSPVQ
jgi:hypothetical protein